MIKELIRTDRVNALFQYWYHRPWPPACLVTYGPCPEPCLAEYLPHGFRTEQTPFPIPHWCYQNQNWFLNCSIWSLLSARCTLKQHAFDCHSSCKSGVWQRFGCVWLSDLEIIIKRHTLKLQTPQAHGPAKAAWKMPLTLWLARALRTMLSLMSCFSSWLHDF